MTWPGQTVINSVPYTISQSGSYVLNKDLLYTSPTGTAITITSGNVTLDFAGHLLDGLGGGPGTIAAGVQIGSDNDPSTYSNVTIKNGTIVGFSIGITLYGGAGHVIQGMRLERQTVGSGGFAAGYAIFNLASGCLFSNNYITNCNGDIADLGYYTQIIRNRIFNCPTVGIICSSAYIESNLV